MFDQLKSLFRQGTATDAPSPHELPVAIAALLVEAAKADEDFTDDERTLIRRVLTSQFDLTVAEVEEVIAEAERAQDAAHDLYQFSRVAKQGLDRDGKMKLIEDLWRIALSDGEVVPYEEMLVRRLVGLLHLEDRDSAIARARAKAE